MLQYRPPLSNLFFSVLLRGNESLLDICSDILTQHRSTEQIDANVRAWHKLVPEQTSMDSNNCWRAQNINTLPVGAKEKIKRMRSSTNMKKVINKQEAERIMNTVLRTDNGSSHAADYQFCLPKTIITGFRKCATTLMYHNILAHPQYAGPTIKECHFWRDFINTKDPTYKQLRVLFYLLFFSDAAQRISHQPDMFTTEGSVSTIFASSYPHQHEEDACALSLTFLRVMPNTNFIIIMRNPIDRLWSDHWFACSYRGRYKTAADAAQQFHTLTVLILEDYIQCSHNHSLLYCTTTLTKKIRSTPPCQRVALTNSIYFAHLRHWINVIPREQLLLVKFEDWLSDFPRTMGKVWNHYGVAQTKKTVEIPMNANQQTKSLKMLPKTRKLLREFFYPFNVKLAELLDDPQYLTWND